MHGRSIHFQNSITNTQLTLGPTVTNSNHTHWKQHCISFKFFSKIRQWQHVQQTAHKEVIKDIAASRVQLVSSTLFSDRKKHGSEEETSELKEISHFCPDYTSAQIHSTTDLTVIIWGFTLLNSWLTQHKRERNCGAYSKSISHFFYASSSRYNSSYVNEAEMRKGKAERDGGQAQVHS